MPWREAVLTDSVGAGVAARYTLGPKVNTPCYLDTIRAWLSPIAGASMPTLTVHWLLKDTLPVDLTDPDVEPPWGNQATTPATRSPPTLPEGQDTPVCAWAPDNTERIMFIYEGGGIPANSHQIVARYWEP